MTKYEEMKDSQSNAIRYLRPPIIERVATVMAEMTPESFEEKLDEWRNLVLPEFPEETPLVEWRLNMQENEHGVPNFDTMNPELYITHRFSRKKQQDGYDWSLRCPIGRLVLNMHSRPGDGRSFDNMRPELAKWVPSWLTHFGLKEPQSVQLHYVNILRRDITPELFSQEGSLNLSEALTIFASVPGEHEHLEPPLDCQIGLRLTGHPDAHLRVHVRDEGKGEGVAIRVTFTATATLEPNASADDALALLNWCHERIVDRFEAVFTDAAKQTFGPQSA